MKYKLSTLRAIQHWLVQLIAGDMMVMLNVNISVVSCNYEAEKPTIKDCNNGQVVNCDFNNPPYFRYIITKANNTNTI